MEDNSLIASAIELKRLSTQISKLKISRISQINRFAVAWIDLKS